MDPEQAAHLLSMPVQDIYGRNMGEIVGAIYDLDGKIESIGVSESAGKFSTYPGERLVRNETGIVVIPEWRAEAHTLAKQRDSIIKRQKAIEELSRCDDLDPRVFEEVKAEIEAVRVSHERLRAKVEERLRELESRHQTVSDFMGIAKVQHVTAEIDEWSYTVTAEFGRVELETDGRELTELRSAIGYLEDIEEKTAAMSEPLPRPETTLSPVVLELLADGNAASGLAVTA